MRRYNEKDIRDIVESRGYTYISYERRKSPREIRVIFKDSSEYLYEFSLHRFGKFMEFNPYIVSPYNSFSLKNISNFCKLENKTFELLSSAYVDSKSKLLYRCFICQDTFYADWNHIHGGSGCANCHGRQLKYSNSFAGKNSEISKEWSNKNTFSLESVAPNSGLSGIWECLVCGFEWKASLITRNKNKGGECPSCNPRTTKILFDGNRLFVLHPEMLSEWNYSKNQGIDPMSISKASGKYFWWVCEKGHEWNAKVSNRASLGRGCPICKSSKGEKKIKLFLENNGILYSREHIFGDCKNECDLRFDFYLIDYNLCIEYMGAQHYAPVKLFGGEIQLKLQKKLDRIKKKYCKTNNINFLEIPYWDFDNINVILENYLS